MSIFEFLDKYTPNLIKVKNIKKNDLDFKIIRIQSHTFLEDKNYFYDVFGALSSNSSNRDGVLSYFELYKNPHEIICYCLRIKILKLLEIINFNEIYHEKYINQINKILKVGNTEIGIKDIEKFKKYISQFGIGFIELEDVLFLADCPPEIFEFEKNTEMFYIVDLSNDNLNVAIIESKKVLKQIKLNEKTLNVLFHNEKIIFNIEEFYF